MAKLQTSWDYIFISRETKVHFFLFQGPKWLSETGVVGNGISGSNAVVTASNYPRGSSIAWLLLWPLEIPRPGRDQGMLEPGNATVFFSSNSSKEFFPKDFPKMTLRFFAGNFWSQDESRMGFQSNVLVASIFEFCRLLTN